MKKLNLIWFIGLFLLALPFVNASFPYSEPNNRTGNETFDSDTVMRINWTNASTSGGVFYHAASQDNAKSYRYVHLLSNPDVEVHCEFFRMRLISSIADCMAVGYTDDSNSSVSVDITKTGCAGTICLRNEQTGGINDVIENVEFDSTWHDWKICSGLNGQINVSINGTLKASGAWAAGWQPRIFAIGRGADSDSIHCEKEIDNWVSVNQSEYTPTPPEPLIITPPVNITFTAKDYYDGVAINNFSVRIFNGTTGKFVDWVETTGNGTIYITNATINQTYNVTFFSNQSYFNVTYVRVNFTEQTFVGEMWQSVFYLNISEVITGNRINTFGASANKTGFNSSNSTYFIGLKVRAGTYNITTNSSPYFNLSDVFSIAALGEKYINISGFGTTKLIINATVVISKEIIINFTTKLNKTNSPNQNYTNNITTTTGSITYYLLNGTYGINFESDNYASQFISLKLNSTDNIWNHTFQVYTTNSINFTFYDEILGKTSFGATGIFNGSTILIEIVSDVYSANFSTQNGSYFADLITPSEYRVSYYTAKYKKREHYFTLKNRSHNVLDLYLLSLTNSTDVTFTIKDESGNTLEGATINLKRYYVDQSAYITVAMGKTDNEGRTVIDVDFDDAFYQTFTTYKTFSKNTEGAKIFKTAITLNIDTLSNSFAKIDLINRIISNISFNNLTQTFSYYFSDPEGLTRTGTLEVLVGDTVVCTSTATSSSATILCAYNLTNSTARVKAIGYIDGSKVPTAIMEILGKVARKAKDLFGKSGLFYTILFAGSVAGLATFSPAVSVIMFLVGLGSMFFMGISFVSTIVYMLIVIIGMLVIWKLKT